MVIFPGRELHPCQPWKRINRSVNAVTAATARAVRVYRICTTNSRPSSEEMPQLIPLGTSIVHAKASIWPGLMPASARSSQHHSRIRTLAPDLPAAYRSLRSQTPIVPLLCTMHPSIRLNSVAVPTPHVPWSRIVRRGGKESCTSSQHRRRKDDPFSFLLFLFFFFAVPLFFVFY